MILNDAGNIAHQCWMDIPKHFPNIILHEYIIMPNHIHGIIEISGNGVRAKNFSPQPPPEISPQPQPEKISPQPPSEKFSANFKSPIKTAGSIIRGFKIGVTKWMRQNTSTYEVWQRDYYDIIIRDSNSFDRISSYIINNPKKWEKDKFHTK